MEQARSQERTQEQAQREKFALHWITQVLQNGTEFFFLPIHWFDYF
jgi:GAF domain-containing protein